VHRLLTPLLRRVYALFAALVAIYLCVALCEYSSWNKERLYRKLVAAAGPERIAAAFDLAYLNGEEQLLRALKAGSLSTRTVAINSLWDLWARAGGHEAFHQIQAANQAIQRKAYPEALRILDHVIQKHPDFPEGWNRRATLYWQMGRFEDSITDAQKVVALNPNHFGAWQGMGLCQVHLGNLDEACRCIRAALKITPHDQGLQKFLGRCEEMLRLLAPSQRTHYDTV
jgi:tetratricopeptide (TPR) repeat protein